MRKYLVGGLFALASASAAQAAPPPTIIFTPGVFSIPGFTTAQVFENFENGVAGTQYNPATQRSAASVALGYTQSASGGADIPIFAGVVPGEGLTPDGDGNDFLAIQSGTFRVNFGATGLTVLSFVLGSIDSYNNLRLFFSDGTSQSFQGQQIIGAPTEGPFNTNINGRVTFDTAGLSAITAAEFSSSQNAFEIDDLAGAVPEPATWAMMIFGFGLVGSQLRARRRRTTVSFA